MSTYTLDWKEYSKTARQAAAEGCVLLRNEDHALPIRPGETVSVFGRSQLNYYKSGTGSGGLVNVPYVHSILDGLRACPKIQVYEPLADVYKDWCQEHPFNKGTGWGTEPWCQEEMILEESTILDARKHSDLAVVIIGRTAGEDRDNSGEEGSYYLTAGERDMLAKVCKVFSRTAVVLNVGNIIDMSWVEEYRPSAVLYAWQGGMEGGTGTADVLCGAVTPCGKLTDTIARSLEDYPSFRNFGSDQENFYQEDIYVGYRYFETFAREKVMYPFGFGLSYTTFSIESGLTWNGHELLVMASVTNTGRVPGKEVVQVYICPPQGKLGKPLRVLAAFAKTDLLAPGETGTLTLPIPKSVLASFDDSGVTGHPSCFVLEEGNYLFYVGTDVRSAENIGAYHQLETEVLEQLQEALAPVKPFRRLRPAFAPDGSVSPVYEDVPLRTSDPARRREERLPSCPAFTGDRGYKLTDVLHGTVTMEDFLAQLSDAELEWMSKGEGMCSPKVTAGTGAAYGGITPSLQSYKIPAGCCSDGPSGIRMDCGTSAFGLPNGTLLSCTFNLPLVTRLFEFEGLELRCNHIDTLLGPGINIHRDPRNGRNFEYHSEDPLLTGKMAAAQLAGMHRYGTTGTLKHFCCNNQEYCRHTTDSVVSARALREIYLKGFEIGVKEGHARSIMTSYNPVNGIWTAGSYDLNTTILRGDWGYQGMVMTDWWAKMNEEGQEGVRTNLASMVKAQNDVYMVTSDTVTNEDNLDDAVKSGKVTRGELVRNAANICRFLLQSPAMERMDGICEEPEQIHQPEDLSSAADLDMEYHTIEDGTILPLDHIPTDGGSTSMIGLTLNQDGIYRISMTISSEASELAQMAVSIFIDGTVLLTGSFHGTNNRPSTVTTEKPISGTTHYLKFHFSQGGLKIHHMEFQRIGDLPQWT
ncbi:MAG: glycoside hydrolase family 3 C-terminal domain-containing protein [Lachnospiraceae bacterium]|nr:glycoside hydrolase family 3 C-terminal domain-containing protein [Lachnospiraceae bacterium]